jgi:hypothetical protein
MKPPCPYTALRATLPVGTPNPATDGRTVTSFRCSGIDATVRQSNFVECRPIKIRFVFFCLTNSVRADLGPTCGNALPAALLKNGSAAAGNAARVATNSPGTRALGHTRAARYTRTPKTAKEAT